MKKQGVNFKDGQMVMHMAMGHEHIREDKWEVVSVNKFINGKFIHKCVITPKEKLNKYGGHKFGKPEVFFVFNNKRFDTVEDFFKKYNLEIDKTLN